MGLSFTRGAESLAEAAKGAGQFAKTHYFGIEDKEKCMIRLITDHDEWVVVNQHQSIRIQKPKPADAKSWPEKMGAVCRNTKLKLPDGSTPTVGEALADVMPPDCYICDHVVDGDKVKRPGARAWAWAVMREEVIEAGVRKGFRDVTREVAVVDKEGKPTGEVKIEKAVVLCNMGHKNFFNIFKGAAGQYGTCLDRDYYVTREGAGTDTVYHIIAAPPTKMDLRDDETMKTRYGHSRAEFNEMLAQEVAGRAEDEFYARFFDPRFDVDKDGKVHPTGHVPPPAGTPPAPSADANADKLAAMQARVAGYAVGDTAPPVAAAAAAQPASTTPAPSNGAAPAAADDVDAVVPDAPMADFD